MVKTFENLLQNHRSDDLETLIGASWIQVYKFYMNDDPGLDLTCFTGRSNLVAYEFIWGISLGS